ncbi:hypothetical protein GpartN1_g6961.t1 [Galdieria partita]|uniref:GOLD domain-containing protein n=1 Tax=Galdieria partita TaxID=83374 RepID=A0A9C7Q332_9RHOD|nr:hypothetical protein GpartN1_g6961.t1 [Galdieria partita]
MKNSYGFVTLFLFTLYWQKVTSFDFVFEPTWNPEDFCFYEEIERGGVLTGNFHVLDPEDSRIDVELFKVNPQGPPELKWDSRGAQRGRISYKAEDGGTYKVCFRSGDITTSRLVSYVVKTGFEGTVEVEAMNALQVGQIEKTYEGLTSLQRELDSALASQYYLRTRLLKHEKTILSTNRAVLVFLLLKTLFVASLVAVKLYFVKRLFDDPKRVRMRV